MSLNSFIPKGDKYQISPAASPEILHHTVWRTWLFIAYSDARWLYYQLSLPSLIQFSLQGWENAVFELGRERVKIQAVFLFFPRRECAFFLDYWIFGNMWCVFLSRANSTARCRRCFVAEFFQVYIVFLVVAIFAKRKCYSPSHLLVRSAMCRTSATYQLSTSRKW